MTNMKEMKMKDDKEDTNASLDQQLDGHDENYDSDEVRDKGYEGSEIINITSS